MTGASFTLHDSECAQEPFVFTLLDWSVPGAFTHTWFSPSGGVSDCAASHLALKYIKTGWVCSAPVGYSSFYVTTTQLDIEQVLYPVLRRRVHVGRWQGLKSHFWGANTRSPSGLVTHPNLGEGELPMPKNHVVWTRLYQRALASVRVTKKKKKNLVFKVFVFFSGPFNDNQNLCSIINEWTTITSTNNREQSRLAYTSNLFVCLHSDEYYLTSGVAFQQVYSICYTVWRFKRRCNWLNGLRCRGHVTLSESNVSAILFKM